MGVRIDSPGVRWWDYHTVGAGIGLLTAEGKIKRTAVTGELETLVSRREYLADASFLAVLQGEPGLVGELLAALSQPRWPLYLGRKCCVPSRPILEHGSGAFPDVLSALTSVPWRPRMRGDAAPASLDCLVEWRPSANQLEAPDDALIWYDVPFSFDPPSYQPRFVLRQRLSVGVSGGVEIAGQPAQRQVPPPPRPRADYGNSRYLSARAARLEADYHLCVFCKAPATTVQHVTYGRAGGNETHDDLRSLCRLCHDTVTMIEYGMGMGLDRINPEDPRWREQIIQKRSEIIRFRSLQTRKRRLSAEEVE
ncbi:MAG: hypothetical protein AMXMBFR61_26930 [Fimbriimonadales bacterium]